jgi:serine/threonine-protein kinase
LSEAKNMAKMSHPNIIKVSDLIDQENKVAIVMEFIEGETLKDYLDKRGKPSGAEIRSMFMQMLDAVEYVHLLNLVHRDIKPSNFMITQEALIVRSQVISLPTILNGTSALDFLIAKWCIQV